jgi:hypothetical protein
MLGSPLVITPDEEITEPEIIDFEELLFEEFGELGILNVDS